ncbi:redoxin domain-containing protein [Sphingobacterium sp. GVS05A]|uniref:redoxin domain-containing protein n=1 Tax=Sphingobacterium sp. GVS05A TaxID=2862679 RepID=UPI001CBF47BF|nr:redoxin domain-containing protein [Sphingobacterium sp. GVS05A]
MNKSARDTLFRPDGYRPYEKVTLLAEGTTSPTWDGLDVDGNRYTSKQFDGKVQLLFLSDINCPANQLSISMLNKLADHYKNQNVQVIGVYPENKNNQQIPVIQPTKVPVTI